MKVPCENAKLQVQGTLIEKEKNGESCILYLKDVQIFQNNKFLAAEGRLPVYLANDFADSMPQLGKKVMVSGCVKTIQEAPNPGNFNQKLYYQRKGIYWILEYAVIENVCGESSVLAETIWNIIACLIDRIHTNMNEKASGVLVAMLLGDTSYMDPEIKEYYQKSGIGHLYAISSLHMNFWGLGLYTLVKRLGGTQKNAVISGIMFLAGYLVLTGKSVSAVRAFLMYSIRMGASMAGREYDGLTAISLAAIIQVSCNPLLITDAGFLLSYGAVLGIYLLGPVINETVGSTIGIPLTVQISLLPIMLYFYYEINVYSFFWNIIAVPIASIILFSGVIGLVIPKLFIIPEILLCVYEKGSFFTTQLPGAKLVIGKPSGLQIFIFYLCVGIGILLLKKNGKAIFTSIMIMMGVVNLTLPQRICSQMEITMLNVGQGDCFFIRLPSGVSCLIDGGSSSVNKVGQYRIESFLKCKGIGTLEYIFVSHGDEDHINGIVELLERTKLGVGIKQLILPPKEVWDESLNHLFLLAKEKNIVVKTIGQGQKMSIGEAKFVCLWPGTSEPGNEASMVLGLTYKNFDMLFTGDLENKSEDSVCDYIENLQYRNYLSADYEVLKVGHHGSRNSTSERLLDLCKVEVAMISAGVNNRYGHPHEEVVSRLAKRRINRYNTLDGNAVILYTDGEKYYILEP